MVAAKVHFEYHAPHVDLGIMELGTPQERTVQLSNPNKFPLRWKIAVVNDQPPAVNVSENDPEDGAMLEAFEKAGCIGANQTIDVVVQCQPLRSGRFERLLRVDVGQLVSDHLRFIGHVQTHRVCFKSSMIQMDAPVFVGRTTRGHVTLVNQSQLPTSFRFQNSATDKYVMTFTPLEVPPPTFFLSLYRNS